MSLCSKKGLSEELFAEQIISECDKETRGDPASHLTLSQYESMSAEEKNHISNRVRQWALKARNSMPKEDHGLFCLVAAHLLKNSHRYFNLHAPSQMQLQILQEKEISEPTRQKIVDEFREVNKKLRVIGNLKVGKRVREQQDLVTEVKGNLSYRKLSAMSGVSLKSLHKWCSVPKIKKHKSKELAKLRKQEFVEFLSQDSISFAHPSKKFSHKRFLRDTLEVTRSKYLQQHQFHKYGIISLSTMKHYRPPNILLCGQTPLDQCLCDRCENCELLLKTLHAIGLKDVPSNRYTTVNTVVCDHRVSQIGSEFSFPRLKCIQGDCENCGEQVLQQLINDGNSELIAQN